MGRSLVRRQWQQRRDWTAMRRHDWMPHEVGRGVRQTAHRSPNVVHYGPNTRQNGGTGQTKDQHETTRFTTPSNLQNLHPRFKSGRRL
jgi:hypothetical protein